MTDREMLELAAKAAGYKKYYSSWLGRDSFVTYDEDVCSEVKKRRVMAEKTMDWNPLTNDGDALRLAVKLEMELKAYNTSAHAASAKAERSVYAIYASEKGDPYAATRRAIVRAAAEIGSKT